MAEHDAGGPETRPLGIDLGTTTTVGATVEGEETRLLEEGEIPTRLAFSSGSFVVGDAATELGDAATTPLPYVDDSASTAAKSGEAQLELYFRLLGELWGTECSIPSDDRAGAGSQGDSPNVADDLEETVDEPSPEEGTLSGADSGRAKSDSSDSEGELLPRYHPTTVAVPGGYSATDIETVEKAAKTTGFGEVTAVRNPLAVAATELSDSEDDRTVAVADIGTTWTSFAIVTLGKDDTLAVEARTTLSDHGRSDLDDTLARWVLGRFEREEGITLVYDDESMRRVRQAAHEALNDIEPKEGATTTIEVELTDDVEITDGGLFGATPIRIEMEVGLSDLFRALSSHLDTYQASIEELVDDADAEGETVVLVGDGTRPAPVTVAIENGFQLPVRLPTRGNRYTATAVGAALISEAREDGNTPILRETFSSDVVLRALGESGIEPRRLDTSGDGPGNTVTGRVRPRSEHQLSGGFQVGYRHRITEEIHASATFVCSNLLSESEADNLAVSITPESAPVGSEIGADTVTIDPETLSDRNQDLLIEQSEDPPQDWLAHSNVDRQLLPDPDGAEDFGDHITTATELALNEVEEDVAREVWVFQKRLRKQIGEDTAVPSDDLDLLLKELDKNLQKHDVELIKPDVGTQMDGTCHEVVEARATDREPETILEVFSYGVAVKGNVLEKASVAVAKGS